jgi:undecaprenyl-diphosphatase
LGTPPLAAPLALTVAAVGWSRITTGRHFPSDVVAGIALGAGCGLIAHLTVARLSTKRASPPAAVIPSSSPG